MAFVGAAAVVMIFIIFLLLLSGLITSRILIGPFWYHCPSFLWTVRISYWSFPSTLLSVVLSIVSQRRHSLGVSRTLFVAGTLIGDASCFVCCVISGV